jgi:hypothetical protein
MVIYDWQGASYSVSASKLDEVVAKVLAYPASNELWVHVRQDQADVYVGRPSKWGNPYKLGRDGDIAQVLEKYVRYVLGRQDLMRSLHELKGKRLGCWCKGKHDCHARVLVGLATRA